MLRKTIKNIALLDLQNFTAEALREIKKIDPQATVVMVSAMGSQEFVLDAIRAGARDFIVKPFESERIRKVLDSL